MLRVVISDTSPVPYLVLIGPADIPSLGGTAPISLPDLDPGEHDTILPALELMADLVLMDDREGVEEARRRGLTVTGTLGVLDRAAERGLIEL